MSVDSIVVMCGFGDVFEETLKSVVFIWIESALVSFSSYSAGRFFLYPTLECANCGSMLSSDKVSTIFSKEVRFFG